jgi:hypothetical protein
VAEVKDKKPDFDVMLFNDKPVEPAMHPTLKKASEEIKKKIEDMKKNSK